MKKLLSLLLALCLVLGIAAIAAADDVPTIKVITLGNGQPANYDAWIAHISPYVEEKIGAKLEVECIGWGDWGNRRSVIINSNEPYDIIFGDSGNLYADVAIGAYLDITDLLADNAQGLLDLIPTGYWDACRVDGRIYGVPTYKDSSITQYFVWDVELLREMGLEEAALNAHTLEEVEPILYAIKDKLGTAPFILTKDGFSQVNFLYDGMSTGLRAVGVHSADKEGKVVFSFEQDDVMDQLKLIRKWFLEGIINSDAANTTEGPSYRPFFLAQGWSGARVQWGNSIGKEAIAVQYTDTTVLSNESVLGSVNFVSVNSEHPDKALAFLNLINTDTKVRDAFYYGLEGDNYVYTAEGRVQKNEESGWGLAGYTQGTFFNVTPTVDDVEDPWGEVKQLNEVALPSVLVGFNLDNSEIADQLSNCAAIWSRYHGELLTGSIDPVEGVAAMKEEMQAEGLDEIMAELQKQVDAFLGK